jgi:hypothetical protein
MSTKGKTVLAVLVCAVAGLIAGTLVRHSASPVVHAADEYRPADAATATTVGARATAYWDARTRQDLYAAYPFYEAGFRSTYEPEEFVKTFQRLNRFSPQIVRLERIEVDASGTRAKVFVTLRSKAPVLEGEELTSTIEDIWMLVDGTWWRQAEAMTPAI